MKEKRHISNNKISITIFLCISAILICVYIASEFYDGSTWIFFKNGNKSGIISAIFTQFLHVDILHLLVNVVGLNFFVYRLCKYISWNHIISVYLISLILTGVALILFAEENRGYLGNSGALLAIFGLWFVIPTGKIDEKNEKFSEFVAIVGSTVFFVNISWIMHISGLIIGIIYGVLMRKLNVKNAKVATLAENLK